MVFCKHLQCCALFAAAALQLVGCAPPGGGGGDRSAGTPQVTVAAAVERSIEEWDDYTGRLAAIDVVEVRSRVSGYLDTVHFEEGAAVAKGQLLFTIDPRSYRAELERAEAELDRAAADYVLAQSRRQRVEPLLASGVISHEEFDQRKAELQSAAAARRSVQAARETAQLNLSFTSIRAPVSGRVGRTTVTPGNLVIGGQTDRSAVLTTIVSSGAMFAYFDAGEVKYGQYRSAAAGSAGGEIPALLAIAEGDTFRHRGRLDFIDNAISATTSTVEMRATFDNPRGELVPGMFVRLRVRAAQELKTILIEEAAVATDQDRRFVYIVGPDKRVQYRPVEVGRRHGELRIVRSGVRAGERVVVEGVQRIKAGVYVVPVERDNEPAAAARSIKAGPTAAG